MRNVNNNHYNNSRYTTGNSSNNRNSYDERKPKKGSIIIILIVAISLGIILLIMGVTSNRYTKLAMLSYGWGDYANTISYGNRAIFQSEELKSCIALATAAQNKETYNDVIESIEEQANELEEEHQQDLDDYKKELEEQYGLNN